MRKQTEKENKMTNNVVNAALIRQLVNNSWDQPVVTVEAAKKKIEHYDYMLTMVQPLTFQRLEA